MEGTRRAVRVADRSANPAWAKNPNAGERCFPLPTGLFDPRYLDDFLRIHLLALIDDWIRDPLNARYAPSVSYQISSELAALIVTFPLYLFVMRIILSETHRAPEKLESGVRKWLTNIALLIAAGVMIGDIVTFLAFYLRGEFTARFVAKVAVTLAISGGVFWYYLGSLRDTRKVAGNAL